MGNTNAELADELELVALVGAVPVAFAPSSTAAQLAELNVEARRIYGEYREAAAHIKTDLGGHESFVASFAAAATGQFGSGWAWLVLKDGKLAITTTGNADTPIAHGQVALLTIDVWEHAYYLDYQNRRADYAEAVIKHLLNWDFANANLQHARAGATPQRRAVGL